jgi:hypothetical protein
MIAAVYLSDPWNRLDVVTLLVCYLSIILEAFVGGLMIRLLRLIRLFRFAKSFPALRAVVECKTLPSAFSAASVPSTTFITTTETHSSTCTLFLPPTALVAATSEVGWVLLLMLIENYMYVSACTLCVQSHWHSSLF